MEYPVFGRIKLLLDNLENSHGASLGTNAAGNALGCRTLSRLDHDLHGADLHALAAGGTQLLVDHVHTGLGVLGDGTGLTDLCALAALDAGHGFSACTLGNHLDAAQIRVKCLKKRSRASADALQACHTLGSFINRKLLHKKRIPFSDLFPHYYTGTA